MLTLRLTQTANGQDKYRVEVALEGEGLIRQTATVPFDFQLTAQEQEDLRWYLEDFLQYPLDPAPKIAARIEARIAEIGAELFNAVFQADKDSRDLWAAVRTRLKDTRVEIVTGVTEATAIPWELIRDPKTDTPLALRARALVRAHPQPSQCPQFPQTKTGPIRILLVICRPERDDDVPFRSVASCLIKGLSESAREAFELNVLRPPTFGQLGYVLRQAKASGQPYHVVHFDGHGVYAKVTQPATVAETLKRLPPFLLTTRRAGAHGYLVFENPQVDENIQLVEGPMLGKLLAETDVPVLVLNSCRSAHAEAPTVPESAKLDIHSRVRLFGSLAQEIMDAGITGVVAMRYNVYVVTAAQFVADLYTALAQGYPLGEAVTLARKQLHDQPLRTIAYDPQMLQDWPVPVVYEAAPIPLFPKSKARKKLSTSMAADKAVPTRGVIDAKLPPCPDVGFFGRDETLLALDRAFDTQNIVLLHAYAGSGKTVTASEFAHWYTLTGGIEGPVLFTSFEQYKPLSRLLDQVGQVFGNALEKSGVDWLALSREEQRAVVLQVFQQVAVLWIFDNVELVAGFPTGTESAWSTVEQQELADFLRAARETKAKFLLTSRRDERSWLGDLPMRITMPPMPMQERMQLARALAEKNDWRLADVDDWRPLLEFTQGNPLTITVLVRQALRDRLKTRDQVEAFVSQLRAGQSAFEDEAHEGRAKSLGASLSYGFEHTFDEGERKQLALLRFFQGFVDVYVLRMMGNAEANWCLPEVRSLTREACIALLDRAAEGGLLTAHGGGFYSIHPALPWYFQRLFREYYGETEREATLAFCNTMGWFGAVCSNSYSEGNRDVIAALAAQEANLLHARQLARRQSWFEAVIGIMQGLDVLYKQTGRRLEWARLVDEIVPDFIDLATNGPLPGREEYWHYVSLYRTHLAEQALNWAEAKRELRIQVDRLRSRAALALALPPEALDAEQRNSIRSLAVSLLALARNLHAQRDTECLTVCEEAMSLFQRIGDRSGEAVISFFLGHTYKEVLIPRDLAKAEYWYRHSLELREKHDGLGQGKCYNELACLALERFKDAAATQWSKEEVLGNLNTAAQLYWQSLAVLPPNAVDDLGVAHNGLAATLYYIGNLDGALMHWRDTIRLLEDTGDSYHAATARLNVALALYDTDRLVDAREYAQAALRDYQPYGTRAAEEIRSAQALIEQIEKQLQAQGG